jgi:CRP/FNR family transcriptional regulator
MAATMKKLGMAELFQGLESGDLRKVAELVEERRYPRGATIFGRNDPSDSLFALEQGLVKLVARSQAGAGTILYLLRPVDIFGELLFSEDKRHFDAVAVTDVLAAVLSRKRFAALISSIPAVALNFIRILSRRLVHVEKGVSEFSHTWSYHRLAKVLLQLCEEHGEASSRGVQIGLPLTHADLADMIGTTRETVTNQLNRFKRMGLVVAAKGRRLLVDRVRLMDFLASGESLAEGRLPPLPRSA